jgi:hypothetical protein
VAQLAQLNIARLAVDWEAPEFAEFRDALDPVNASADSSEGFVWRLQAEPGDDPALDAFEAEGWLFNLTVWRSVEHLLAFVRSPGHLAIMRRRGEWFEPGQSVTVLWWVEEGARPAFDEAMNRLARFREHGSTADAFSFSERFPPPS